MSDRVCPECGLSFRPCSFGTHRKSCKGLNVCTKCSNKKEPEDFPRHRKSKTGRSTVCKSCKNRKYREDPAERLARSTAKNRESDRESYQRNREKILGRRRGNPEERARRKLNYEIERGRVTRPDRCSECGVGCRAEAHHHDYSKPLEVTWLCRKCHKWKHRKYETEPRRVDGLEVANV